MFVTKDNYYPYQNTRTIKILSGEPIGIARGP